MILKVLGYESANFDKRKMRPNLIFQHQGVWIVIVLVIFIAISIVIAIFAVILILIGLDKNQFGFVTHQ